VDRSFCPEN